MSHMAHKATQGMKIFVGDKQSSETHRGELYVVDKTNLYSVW